MRAFGGSSTVVRSAPQGSRPAPTVPESGAAPASAAGICQGAVAADELPAVARPVGLAAGKIGECDARSEGRIPWIAREHRAGVGIDLGRNEWRRGTARRTEHPFDISRDRQPPRPARRIAQLQARDLDRIAERHVLQQIRRRCRALHARTGCSPSRAGRHRWPVSSRIGSAVGHHSSPVSSSRR